MPFNTNNMLAKQAMAGKGIRDSIPLNEICLRYRNKYINSYDDAESIKQSIEKDGLIEPITVNDIDAYLKSSDNESLSTEAKSYYVLKLSEGFKYFITTGHRRFFAYCSLAIGRDIHGAVDMDEFYEDFKKVAEANTQAVANGDFASMNKYASIKAFVAKDNVKEERERYNVANLDQRITKDFEIIDNMIDEMREDGELEKIINENKVNRIKLMSDRTVMDNLKRLNLANSIKTSEEARDVLMSVEASSLAGYHSDLNLSISNYIKEKRHKNVSVQSVDKARKILETLDHRLIDYIYSGNLEYKNAIDMLSYYDKISVEELDDICEQIKNRTYDPLKTKKKYSTKPIKKKIPMSEKDWVNMFKKIFAGEMSLDEAKEMLESLNLI